MYISRHSINQDHWTGNNIIPIWHFREGSIFVQEFLCLCGYNRGAMQWCRKYRNVDDHRPEED